MQEIINVKTRDKVEVSIRKNTTIAWYGPKDSSIEPQ